MKTQVIQFSLCISSALIALISLTLTVRGIAKHERKETVYSKDENLCIDAHLFPVHERGSEKICVNTSIQLMAILEKIIAYQDDHRVRPILEESKHSFTPVSVHTRLRASKESSTESETSVKHFSFTFDQEEINSFKEHIRGAELRQDGLLIYYTGLYYIYSNIKVLEKPSLQTKTVYVYVHRNSPNSPSTSGVLLRSVFTGTSETNAHKSIYNGGLFHLQEGDIIQVCSSQTELIDMDNESNVFGLFMLNTN